MKNKAPVQKALRVCKELNVLNWLFQPVKLSVSRTEKPHQEIFKGLNLSNTEHIKFDQIHEDEEQSSEYALAEGSFAKELANNMNVEPTTQPKT